MLANRPDTSSRASAPARMGLAVSHPSRRSGAPSRAARRALAQACFDDLPAPYRDVLWLVEIEQLPPADVARRLDIGEPVVVARLQRARQLAARALCRECLPAAVTR